MLGSYVKIVYDLFCDSLLTSEIAVLPQFDVL